MSQYTTTTGAAAQPHKVSMVDKVKASAEGLVDKITGHQHAGTNTGAYGGEQQNMGTGGQQYAGTNNPGYGGQQQQPMGNTAGGPGYGGQQQTMGDALGYGQQQQQQRPSMMDKVKGIITPGHQNDTIGANHGTGTGHHNTNMGTDYSSTATPGTGGLSTTDKIKNMLPGHHKNTGAGTGYN